MSLLAKLGVILNFLGILTATFLYRTLPFGAFMHASPYAVVLAGTVLLLLAPDAKDPFMVIFFAGITAIVHASVCFEMAQDAKKSRAQQD